MQQIQNCKNKLAALRKIADRQKISLNNISYMGNDINDLECLKAVGLPVCVADSHPEILNACKFTTKNRGGHGAVREFCDYIYNTSKSLS